MKRTLLFMIGVTSLTLSLLHQPAFAAFSSFERLGALYYSNPSCTSRVVDEVICAVVGSDKALYVNRTVDGGITWNGLPTPCSRPDCFQYLDGIIVGNPSCTGDNNRSVICAVLGADQGLYVRSTSDGTNWSGFQSLGEMIFSSDPSCTSRVAGEVICAVVGRDNFLYVNRTVDGGITWNGLPTPCSGPDCFQRLEGILAFVRNPSCTGDTAGSVICMVISTDHLLYINRTSDGTNWSGYQSKNLQFDYVVGNPSCASRLRLQEVICGVLLLDHSLSVFRTVNAGVDWETPRNLGGPFFGNPSCTSNFAQGVICAVIGTDSGLYAHSTTNGVTYSFQALPGIAASDPSCTDAHDVIGLVVCAVLGIDSAVWVTHATF
jgi:hypothetical protein